MQIDDRNDDAARIHQFWFGDATDDAETARQQGKLWWTKKTETDNLIRERFAPLIEAALRDDLDSWAQTPHGLLSLILLTDQFARNVWRDTPAAFAADAKALGLCRLGLSKGFDQQLRPIERVFHYLPLEHSENLQDQDHAVALFEALCDAVPEASREPFDGFLDFARRHRDVIARFGRFPHRNDILGRVSTADEVQFLSQPGSRF